MQKIELILMIILTFTAGCSVIDKTNKKQILKNTENGKILSETLSKNITDKIFFIEKAKICIITKNETNRFIFNVKFNEKKEYLISVNAIKGVEILKVFISDDSVLINNRIRKEILVGEHKDLEKITGFPVGLLKVCLGDFYCETENRSNLINCNNNRAISESYYGKYAVKSIIDCNIKKIVSAEINNILNNSEIKLNYREHKKGNNRIPGIVEISDLKRNLIIVIEILRINESWDNEFKFRPGLNYKKKNII